jgi:hypothetical protein
MKIAVLGTRGFPGIQGGVENHCEHLYPRLAANGCDVAVYVRKPYLQKKWDTKDIPEYRGVKLIALSCPKNKFLEAFFHTFRGIIDAKN